MTEGRRHCLRFFPAGAESEGAAGGLYCGDFRAGIPFGVPAYRCGGGAVPRTFTHHVLVSGTGEIDDELMGWVKEAAVFSAGKR